MLRKTCFLLVISIMALAAVHFFGIVAFGEESSEGIHVIVDDYRIDAKTIKVTEYLFLPSFVDLDSLEIQGASEEEEFSLQIMTGSHIPTIFLTSFDQENEGREFVDADKTNSTTGSMNMISADGASIYAGKLTQIKARGNTTFFYTDKKSYQIKLASKTDLLGNNEKVKTWVLLAGFADATKIHDKTMKDLAVSVGMPFVAGSTWVDLYYDGEYRGLYLLSEKNSVNKTGVNIADMEDEYKELNEGYSNSATIDFAKNKYGQAYQYTPNLIDPEDITGGYLLELNGSKVDEASGFYTRRQHHAVNVKSPEWGSKNAICYISELYQEFEDAVYSTDSAGHYTGFNEATGKYYYEYVDKESLVKMFLLRELSCNPDEFMRSTFFYKDKGADVLVCGPIWDQDLVFGSGWNKSISPDNPTRPYLVEALVKIPDFQDAVREYYQGGFSEQARSLLGVDGILSDNSALIWDSVEMDHILWSYVKIGNPSIPNHLWPNGTTYQDIVDNMINWVEQRIAYIDKYLGPGTSGPLEEESNDSPSNNGNGGNGGNGGYGGAIPGESTPSPSESDPEPIDEDSVPTALDLEDVPGDAYYHDAVNWAVSKDITNGIDETHFGPDGSCTRAQMVTFLWRASGSPETPSQSASQTAPPEGGAKECPFTDVEAGSYYEKAVLWAVEQGITTGTSETTFSPDDSVTRGQSVTFLYRMKNPLSQSASPSDSSPEEGAKECVFTDAAEDAYYCDAVLWAVENGVTTGKTETLFGPDDDCTRAQIVTFLYRAMND